MVELPEAIDVERDKVPEILAGIDANGWRLIYEAEYADDVAAAEALRYSMGYVVEPDFCGIEITFSDTSGMSGSSPIETSTPVLTKTSTELVDLSNDPTIGAPSTSGLAEALFFGATPKQSLAEALFFGVGATLSRQTSPATV